MKTGITIWMVSILSTTHLNAESLLLIDSAEQVHFALFTYCNDQNSKTGVQFINQDSKVIKSDLIDQQKCEIIKINLSDKDQYLFAVTTTSEEKSIIQPDLIELLDSDSTNEILKGIYIGVAVIVLPSLFKSIISSWILSKQLNQQYLNLLRNCINQQDDLQFKVTIPYSLQNPIEKYDLVLMLTSKSLFNKIHRLTSLIEEKQKNPNGIQYFKSQLKKLPNYDAICAEFS